MIGLTRHFVREMNIFLSGLPFHGREVTLERNQTGTGPLRFLANPQLSTDVIYLYQLPLSWASHAIPLSMMSYRGLMLGLKANIFLYP